MKKAILISLLLALFVVPSDANNVLVLNQRGEQVNSVTNDKYYVIAGYAQNGSTTNFLYDTGAGVKATSLTTGSTSSNLFVWRLMGNTTDGFVVQNMSTGNYMSLGSYDGSPISMGATSQNLSIV
ncbi:MAG: hypothetical protein II081_03205, partial [Prevotella sp.]|nr:hypothetical protein [Prevotella sp.]